MRSSRSFTDGIPSVYDVKRKKTSQFYEVPTQEQSCYARNRFYGNWTRLGKPAVRTGSKSASAYDSGAL